jgi:hypothetical protein
MATKILRHIWDGGSGFDDREVLIGYCNEQPIEVLEKLIKTHCIYSYRTSYCRPIEEYPSNCNGLVIKDYNAEDEKQYGLDITITRSINDYINFEMFKKHEWNKFDISKFKNRVERIKEYAQHFEDINPYKKIYLNIYEDFKKVYEKISR